MTEVNLAKRLFILALFVLVALSVVACTRDKPEPVPATVVAPLVALPTSVTITPTVTSLITPVVTTIVPVTPTAIVILPSVTPPPTITPSASQPVSAPGTYTVKWGDWLNKIAAENGVTVQAILAANPGLNPNRIYPGQVLNLPAPGGSSSSASSSASSTPAENPSTYTVQRGEWIYAIARKFGVTVPALLAANPGINANVLYPGQVLNIPGAGTTPPPGSGAYTVLPGDTLFSIAVRFKTTTYALQIKNNLANPNFIYPGQALTIP